METKETAIALLKKEMPELKAIMGLSKNKGQDVATMVKNELDHLQSLAIAMPAIMECMPLSVVTAVKSVLKQNLSLDPHAGLVYVQTRNVLVGDKWQKVLEIKPSPNGIISISRQSGRILDVDRPTIKKDASGKVTDVSFKYLVPTINSDNKKSARWVEITFDESDFERWQTASHNERAKSYKPHVPLTKAQIEKGWNEPKKMPEPDPIKLNYANKLYTSWKGGPDPEFIRAKAIRHGLKKLGTNQNELIQSYGSFMTPIVDANVEAEHEEETTAFEEISSEPLKPEPIKEQKTEIKIPSANSL